jgi:hypothetical protein
MTTLISTKTARKFRVIADGFGRSADEHSDILVGDFDSIEQAREAAAPWRSHPRCEHWSVTIFDADGRVTQ